MARTISATLTLAFRDATDRNFKFNGVDISNVADIKNKVLAINANMPDYFAQTFVSDSGSPCIMISKAQYTITDEEVVYSAS